jgi:NAD+-dependent secondary alcohol dehydrogenase Adh1
MKAVRVHAYHEPARIEEVPEPKVAGPHDVLVRLGGIGVCRTDLHILEGQWAAKSGVTLPYTLGHENAGWVEAVGSAVEEVQPGDPVILHPLVTCGLCDACRRGDDCHCERSRFPGIDTDGGYAELLLTGIRSVVKLGPSVEPAAVAPLADAGLTAYHAVRKAAPRLYPGTTAIVIGVGGLGHIALQCLPALTAARVIAVDRSPESLALAKELGAAEQVLADGKEVDRVLELTDGKGAHVVFDFVAEPGVPATGIAMTRRHGDYYVIGYGGSVEVPAIELISREVSVVGNLVGTYSDLVELMALAEAGVVALRTQRYPLASALDALADLDAGRIHGRAVLVP